MKKVMKWTGIMIGAMIGLTLLAGFILYPIGMKKLTRTYPDIPVEKVNIPIGPDAVAHGRHIAAIWNCSGCHGTDLSGKLLTNDAVLGTIPASNLTAGKGGIGASYSDTDWVRAIRHGVKPDGHVVVFMNDYSALSDQDLGDLIAYLKQLPPVDVEYPALHLGPIVPLAPAVGFLTPAAEQVDHTAPRPSEPAPGATVEYGKYLFATCTECHSTRLASDLVDWQQEDFVRALRSGALPDGKQLASGMPVKAFAEMNDTELTALWVYLQSLLPAKAQK